MPCNLNLASFTYDYCDTNLAGVKAIYVNDRSNIIVTDGTGGVATVTLTAPAKKFVNLPFAKNTASYTSTLTKNESQGTRYYSTELVANINKLDAEKNVLFSGSGEDIGLDAGRLAIIVVDKNNVNWLLGDNDYAMTTALTAQTGAAPDDGNFYTWTVTDESPRLPYTIDASTLATLIEAPTA